MRVNLGENIRRFRKQNSLTQENLAEALGVTVGAISKWELGASSPDIQFIAEMADFFETSIDVLFGYELQSNTLTTTLEELDQCRQTKNYAQGLKLVEKALQKYPNNLLVTYKCGRLLSLFGMEKNDKTSTERAITLLYRSIELFSQNNDVDLSETQIYSNIAECYMFMHKPEEALELLKKHNPGGLNNATIAMIYAVDIKEPELAFPYLTKSLGEILQTLLRTILGFSNAYIQKKQFNQAYDALIWLIQILVSFKSSERSVTYIDKLVAIFNAGCAIIAIRLNRFDDAKEHLRQAYSLAKLFDAHPDYGMRNLRFCETAPTTAIAYDDLGETALGGIILTLEGSEEDKELLMEMWEEVCHENGE